MHRAAVSSGKLAASLLSSALVCAMVSPGILHPGHPPSCRPHVWSSCLSCGLPAVLNSPAALCKQPVPPQSQQIEIPFHGMTTKSLPCRSASCLGCRPDADCDSFGQHRALESWYPEMWSSFICQKRHCAAMATILISGTAAQSPKGSEHLY